MPYNTGSVMHYSSTAFSKNGQKTIEALVSSNETNALLTLNQFANKFLTKTNYRMVTLTLRKWAKEKVLVTATY